MIKSASRHAALVLGTLAIAFLSVLAIPALTNARGAAGPTIFNAQSQFAAGMSALGVMLGGAIIAGLVGRATNTMVGIFALGAGLFALTGRLETVKEVVFSQSSLWALPGETLMLTACAFIMVLIVFLIAGPLTDIREDAKGHKPNAYTSPEAFKQALAGVLVLFVVWALAQSPLKGQVFASVLIGSMIAGLVGRLLSPHVQPILICVSPMLFGAIGHIVAAWSTDTPLDVTLAQGRLTHFAFALPLDYLAGSLAGVPLGIGWARSFLHHDDGGHA